MAEEWAAPGADAVLTARNAVGARRVKIARLTATQLIVREKTRSYEYDVRFRRPGRALGDWISYQQIVPRDVYTDMATLHHPDSPQGVLLMAVATVAVRKDRFRGLAQEFANDPTHAVQESVQDAMKYLIQATIALADIEEEQKRR